MISALGDHLTLPMFFGVVTKSFPLCLLTKFLGVKEESVTLHQPANANMLTPADCISVFRKICSALGHVHLKGYLHNDLKANNVVLERASASAPAIIDFGKSTKHCHFNCTKIIRLLNAMRKAIWHQRFYTNDVTALQVTYSLRRMLKAVSCLVWFYQRVQELIKEMTKEKPSERPSFKVFTQKISEIEVKVLRCQITI